MFPFEISSSYFEPEMSSSSSSSPESAPPCSDSDSSMLTTSSSVSTVPKKVPCFFDSLTFQRQKFSIPDKIVYYLAKNVKNAETFKKLVQTCKYFFVINPVIVVQQLECHRHEWDCSDKDGEYRVGFKYDQPKNFKVWITEKIVCFSGKASKVIPWIYKNDAKNVLLRRQPLKLDEFLCLAGNAEELFMWKQLVKYENGEIVQLEDIVKNLPKLKKLDYQQYVDGSDINSETVRKLMEIEHFKHLTQLVLYTLLEVLNVEEMFNYIIENRHIEVELCYRRAISFAYKELVEEYSNRLKNEEGCNSRIKYECMDIGADIELQMASSVASSSETSFDNFDDDDTVNPDVDENEDLFFPWNNEDEEEWELPWDQE